MKLSKNKKSITIEHVEGKNYFIKCNSVMQSSDVCDMLLSALCVALKAAAKYSGVSIDIYKQVAISEIQKLD